MSAAIAVAGLPFFGQQVATSLRTEGFRARYVPAPGRAWLGHPGFPLTLLRADLVYAIGSSIRRRSPIDLLACAGRPILMHWVGSDVRHALKAFDEGKVSHRLVERATHWADAPWLIEELAPLGMRVTEHPLPIPIATGRPLPMPAEPAILVYLPRNPHAAYDVAGTLHVFDALPGVRFLLAGGYPLSPARPNVEQLGYVTDWDPAYARTAVHLRLTHHDGLSHTVIEALSYGRHVVWTCPFPGVRRVAGPAEAVDALRELLGAPLAINDAGLQAADRYRAESILPAAAADLEALLR